MKKKLKLTLDIKPDQAGSYFTLPFEMPANVEKLTVHYSYERHIRQDFESGNGIFTAKREVNVIDIGLISPDGRQVGVSGSDKKEFHISETEATPGYNPCKLEPGRWEILVGAYKVNSGGVKVTYELSFDFKRQRLFRGDLHMHTVASDGVFTVGELAQRAKLNGLDFIAVTDHNQPVSLKSLPFIPGITLIQGLEWTHYKGHANLLGVDMPYDKPFWTNTPAEARQLLESARQRGALIIINHPFDENTGFRFNLEDFPYDCLCVWNGPMRGQNFQAIELWQELLVSGKKVPACGGSDYHRDMPMVYPGAPTTCVYSLSPSPDNLLNALKAGHSYITYAPEGPVLMLKAGRKGSVTKMDDAVHGILNDRENLAGDKNFSEKNQATDSSYEVNDPTDFRDAIMGDSVTWCSDSELHIFLDNLRAGDIVKIVGPEESKDLLISPEDGSFKTVYPVKKPGFLRLEVWRLFLPGIPELPALLSNPVYFDDSELKE